MTTIYQKGCEFSQKLNVSVDNFNDVEVLVSEFDEEQDRRINLRLSKEEAMTLAQSIINHFSK